MNIAQIEINMQKLVKTFSRKTFIYELLLAYGLPKASITRLRKGNLNLSKVEGEVSWKKKVLFRKIFDLDLHIAVSEMATQIKHEQRFVIATDYKLFLAIDTQTQDKLDVDLKDLPKHFDFFLPWAGMEKAQHADENPADIKAAERMAKLFDEIKKDNSDDSPDFSHGLNVFLSRILFCFFAEDTNIFKSGQFTHGISSHTQSDGSDLHDYLDILFEVLNTRTKKRRYLPEYLNDFPYVNGGLYSEKLKTPKFTRRSRQAIIDSGELDWSAINPDIFGSMIQAVITPVHRGGLGVHYTSVPNIMKVIGPLFLNDLREEYERQNSHPQKLQELLSRMGRIKIFDPACGSGNFLVIAYKELRKLEIKIIHRLEVLQTEATSLGMKSEQQSFVPKSQLSMATSFQIELFSRIQLSQFYGIELDDFAHEIAQLSLWLAEHQMNTEFFKEFGRSSPTLPLKEAGHIVHGNACRIEWEIICPKKEGEEIYILGNPPYLGQKKQNNEQKDDLKFLFSPITKRYKTLDYISCWFLKAVNYLNRNSSFAFVSTNSICQGNHVPLLWPHLLKQSKVGIIFAVKNFKWENNAKSQAGVTCSIVGMGMNSSRKKNIYVGNNILTVKNISPYLSNSKNIIVEKRVNNLSSIPKMVSGNMALDDGHLMLTDIEKNDIVENYPDAEIFIRETTGGKEFLYDIKRWCIWVEDDNRAEAETIPPLKNRIEACYNFRINGGEVAKTLAYRAHQFRYRHIPNQHQIIIPQTTSENREYIPFGFLNEDVVIQQSAQVIYDPEPFILGVLSSRIHLLWVISVGGKQESRIRYSPSNCYTTFPFPIISTQRKNEITQAVFRILEEREKHSEKTLAQLYDPGKMPAGLREAHRINDIVIEKVYR
ncbi:MAG: class I SAM-dependent DNA methyltransferase, partial [Bacteroidetes bacterium]|nr:class I SAM-dependent DNA methyltransferase [Bacteroidota bacterium]